MDVLQVGLHGQHVGELVRFSNGRIQFEFDPQYAGQHAPPTLSLSFLDERGGLSGGGPDASSGQVPPFFANMLPEGHLRAYLAQRAGVRETREFELLELLGEDLPGAVVVRGEGKVGAGGRGVDDRAPGEAPLRFSLAGVQLKFSALADAGGGLTIPAQGMGGDWILKLPSVVYEDVPENEYSIMSLAATAGLVTPEIRLVPLEQIVGLPDEVIDGRMAGAQALAVRRFDRTQDGRVHAEDFAQIFGQRPRDKYLGYTCADMASVLATFCDERSVEEFARRLMYSALVGNGDMHTKNWSVLYRDGRTPELSPAYDLLCTSAYIPDDEPALKLGTARRWQSLALDDFGLVADAAQVNRENFVRVATETSLRFRDCWEEAARSLPLRPAVKKAIEHQLAMVPAVQGTQRVRRVRPRRRAQAKRAPKLSFDS